MAMRHRQMRAGRELFQLRECLIHSIIVTDGNGSRFHQDLALPVCVSEGSSFGLSFDGIATVGDVNIQIPGGVTEDGQVSILYEQVDDQASPSMNIPFEQFLAGPPPYHPNEWQMEEGASIYTPPRVVDAPTVWTPKMDLKKLDDMMGAGMLKPEETEKVSADELDELFAKIDALVEDDDG